MVTTSSVPESAAVGRLIADAGGVEGGAWAVAGSVATLGAVSTGGGLDFDQKQKSAASR